ncbi:hypothetical protein RHGRI_030044 [Rhododendron griersonianum]|uniref:Uncharacterized protein n=1 Tax=Rhododendron griersonianum TaxID=479676 RepID=A0AAV6IPM1_9ERIC|nr:hypothetical protein RHGRI_030044 [Rhododendron griersonianum]
MIRSSVLVIATICEELPQESVILVYLSATGKARHPNVSQIESSGVLKKSSKLKVVSHTSHGQNNSLYENHVDDKGNSGQCLEDSFKSLLLKSNVFYALSLHFIFDAPSQKLLELSCSCSRISFDAPSHKRLEFSGSNCLYPGDLIPFTRRPLFLIIDSDISYAFKAVDYVSFAFQVLHGSERGEPAALLLSPLKPSFKRADVTQSGSQFTLFLTAPLQAFCELVGLTYSDSDAESYNDADNILSTSFSEWEVILCTSTTLDLVWAQVLSDPFLRRLILRFIFCRSVLAHFCPRENRDQYLPVCLPQLLDSLSPSSEVVQSAVFRLANHLDVADCFHLNDR